MHPSEDDTTDKLIALNMRLCRVSGSASVLITSIGAVYAQTESVLLVLLAIASIACISAAYFFYKSLLIEKEKPKIIVTSA
jgi:hypothetical protein